MAVETFIVHKEWLDNISGLPIEQQDKIIAEFVRYGCGMELQHSDDAFAQAMVNMLKNRIDYSKDKYLQKIEMGKTAGRKKKVNDMEIYQLAREGKTANEIATILDISKSTVDHSIGWKERKNEEFVF